MKIADVLRNKGEGVVTISPDDTVAHLLEVLNERGEWTPSRLAG